MLKKISLFLLVVSAFTSVFAQSAEKGSHFNQYMSAEAGVNLLSGTVALSKTLASISAGDAQASFTMNYSGNVTQTVNNRNDVAPTGWLGLGWSMGFAKIVVEHNGSMALIDDSYYLMTAEGGRHKIFYENERWWIENLPYWRVTPTIRYGVTYGDKSYSIIVGWTLTDDSGREYSYGDFDENSALQSGSVKRNATQYVLAWPKTYGRVGSSISGNAYPYPSAWNLSKIKDLKGNYLSYDYMQKGEALAVGSWRSDANNATYARYTKECYLKTVKSSDGSKVEFILKPKGEGVFLNEYLDMTGNVEKNENDADAFIDPIERHYLAGVELYAKDGTTVLSKVEFCYSSLALAPKQMTQQGPVKMLSDSRYLKRIMKSVVFTNGNGDIVDKEEYFYNTDEKDADPKKNIPFGMLTSVVGSNCGKVEFSYTYENPSNADSLNLHSQNIRLRNVSSIGYLEDGTPYILGFDKENKLSIYFRIFGKWQWAAQYSKDVFEYKENASFMIGDKGWFVCVIPNKDGEGASYTPFVWNGRKFVRQETIEDGGSRTSIALGAGFIFKAKIKGNNYSLERSKIELTIPWSIWGKEYKIEDFVNESNEKDNDFAGDDGAQDRRAIKVFASANHVGIFYLDTDGYNNGRIRIYTFNHSKDKLVKTFDKGDLDDDNKYVFNGDFLYAATEDRGPLGHNAEVFQWHEPLTENDTAKWNSAKQWDLHGVQGEPSIEAFGSNYFVVRHNDNDDMSVFYWDGEKWESKYKNLNMVSSDKFDFFYESEWNGFSGNDFFIARQPLIEKRFSSIVHKLIVPFGFWAVIRHVDVLSSTYRGALLDRYDFHDGIWSNTGAQNLSNSEDKTNVMVGEDWYIEKTSKKAFTWNGLEWIDRTLPKQLDFGEKFKTLGGRYFAIENGFNTKIYFKKSDNFDGPYGSYVVTKKTIFDPVMDKVVEYNYSYQWAEDSVTFDFLNNTPIIKGYTVTLPNEIGIQTKKLCDRINYDSENFDYGIGAGQICFEETRSGRNKSFTTNKKTISYNRYFGESLNWPSKIHIDQISEVETIANKSRSKEKYEYSPKNGQIKSVKTFLGIMNVPVKEKRIDYAFEKYSSMERANRLIEEAGVKECLGHCDSSGKQNVFFAQASRFKNESGYDVVSDVWSYKNTKNINQVFPEFNYFSDYQSDKNWKKNTTYTKYENKKAVESVNELGIKSAAIYEDKADGSLISSVVNAGYDEVFVLSGAANSIAAEKQEHEVSVKNYRYDIVPLKCGNAVDLYNRKVTQKDNQKCHDVSDPMQQDKESNYGRFTKTAVFVNAQHQLKGSVTPASKKKYVFSAWVQGVTSGGKAFLKIDGNRRKEWNLEGDGKWQQIEWETDLDPRRYEFELAADANQLRVQNALFIPSNASATITYWDKVWEKPVATVNDRGIGSYSKLDNSGRSVQSFSEDVSGNIVKLSETEYRISECRANPAGNGNLKSLEINGKSMSGIKNGETSFVVLPNSTDDVRVKWIPAQIGDQVRYVLRQKSSKELNWKTACCSAFEGATESISGGDSWELLVDVFPFDDIYYTIEISKSTSGWIDYGSPRKIGESPVFASSSKPDVMYYLSNNGVVYSKNNGNIWSDYATNISVNSQMLNATSNGIQSYVLTMPAVDWDSKYDCTTEDRSYKTEDRKYNNTSAVVYDGIASISGNTASLSMNGQVGSAGEMSDYNRVTIDNDGKLYVLYQRTVNEGNATIVKGQKTERSGKAVSNLIVKSYNAGSKTWNTVGNTLAINNNKPVIVPDVVSDNGVMDADIIADDDGNLYVAYIGQIYATAAEDEEKTDISSVLPRFVVVKKLYPAKTIDQSIDKQIWASPSKFDVENNGKMIPDFNGDLLEVIPSAGEDYMPITSVTRVKFAKSSKNLYLAVLYQLTADNNNSNKRYALSIFKATQKNEKVTLEDGVTHLKKDAFRFEPLVDQFIKTSISNPTTIDEKRKVEEERRIVAIFDDSDPFDLVVTDESGVDVPYVMFANEQNDNKVSVVMYDGSRWISVGSPAFDEIVNTSESAKLAVGSNGKPYVAFKESPTSANASRRNHIVTKRYSDTNDKDLTLNTLGNPSKTTLASDFRQYILKYYTWVPNDYSVMKIKPEPKTVGDVSSVIIENNGSVVYSWENPKMSGGVFAKLFPALFSSSKLVSIPSVGIALSAGSNVISVKVYGSDGDFLTYTICVEREIVADENFSMAGQDNVVEEFGSGNSSEGASDNGNGDVITWVSYGEKGTRNICFQFSAFWNMIYNGITYYANTCLGLEFDASDCSESNVRTFTLVGPKGITKTVKLYDGSCEKNQNDPYESSAYVGSSGSSGVDDPSNPDDPNNPSSSGSNEKIPENIPAEFASLYAYDVYAGQVMTVSDRVELHGDAYVCTDVNVGVNAKVYGSLSVKGNAELRNFAYVENLHVEGNTTQQMGAQTSSLTTSYVFLPELTTNVVDYGYADLYVYSNQTATIQPGSYKQVHIYAGAKVTIESGVYNVESFIVEPDAEISFANDNDPIQLWIQNELRFGDRVKVNSSGAMENLFIYTNASNVYIGVASSLKAILAAPNAKVDVSSQSTLSGKIWAKEVTIQPDAVLK